MSNYSPATEAALDIPRGDHQYHFRVNGRRYGASTGTDDKHMARDIEARERSRVLEGCHGIRRQPDLAFKQFAEMYLRDCGTHKRDKGTATATR